MKLKLIFFLCSMLSFSWGISQEVNFQIDENSWQADFKFLKKKDRLFLVMKRKMKSFFEINTELYFQSEGIISTDIENVTLHYRQTGSEVRLETLQWKGASLPFN